MAHDKRNAKPLRRTMLFVLVAIVLVVVAIEVVSLLALSLRHGRLMTPTRVRETISATVVPVTEEGRREDFDDWAAWRQIFALHPYVGYVFDADFEREPRLDIGGRDAVDFGFSLAEPGVFFEPEDRRLVIAVTGGSIAFNLARRFGDHIRDVVAEELAEKFDQVIVVNLAIPGHHQPQQLLMINYLVTLGAHFDVVVNLDGFNEIALAPAENLSQGVAPFFPHAWYFKSADLASDERLAAAEMAVLEHRRRRLAGRFSRAPWRASCTASVVWSFLDARAVRRMHALNRQIIEHRQDGTTPFVVSGPPSDPKPRAEILHQMAEIWSRSSLQLAVACDAIGARYFHFLQPNQYVVDSKPMGEDEAAVALNWNLERSAYARDGYPLLIASGARLRARGIRFHDLTMLFAETAEPTYIDDCCHYTSLGDSLLAQAIADAIAADFRRAPP